MARTTRSARVICLLCLLAVSTTFVHSSMGVKSLRGPSSAYRIDDAALTTKHSLEAEVWSLPSSVTATALAMVVGLAAAMAPAQAFFGFGEEKKEAPKVQATDLQNVESAKARAAASQKQYEEELTKLVAAQKGALSKEERNRRQFELIAKAQAAGSIDNMEDPNFALSANLGPSFKRENNNLQAL
eukprot:TRINITY_DN4787_c0_g1_i3.p1 TRINITY_DN4787_c0_g1~~TRINITY_DN4787_c0_g1_i3.p1  ORF type:complete len:186 (+),score=50.59 TRINITY_DN4787_c0_g1_i3:77-634(+)